VPKKIKRIEIEKSRDSNIKPTKARINQGISFSFKYYQNRHDKFSCRDKEIAYCLALLDRLVNRSKTLRCHPIAWQDTTENGFGLPNEEQLVDTPYQFSLSSNEHGRVHGFFIDNVFYIVWLDPNHLLYS
jgi:hypothetical protein